MGIKAAMKGRGCSISSAVAALSLSATLVCGLYSYTGAQSIPPKYSIVRLAEPSRTDLERIARLGIDVDAGPGMSDAILHVNERELRLLRENGFAPQVVHDDATAYYARRLDSSLGPGSMGGYYTLSEVVAWMDSMAVAHPGVISPKFSVGESIEGRSIWGFVVSEDPDASDPDLSRPAVFYNSLIHAREAIGMMVLLGFVEDMANRYAAGDPAVRYLLSSRELWFLPVVNPDGYYYNEVTAASGGGMWRKNMRDNDGDGVFDSAVDGVDLNRNFGFHWGEDDIGSSPDFAANDYRGAAPFSEPETRAVRDMGRMRPFEFIINYHSYSDVYIHPWGYTTETVEHIDDFRAWCAAMAGYNGFPWGTDAAMIGYYTNGSATDWQYGADGVLAVVPEVGNRNDAFWPSTERIAELVGEHIGPNYITAWMAGGVLLPEDFAVTGGDGGGDSGMYELTVKWGNAGISLALAGASVTATALTPGLTLLQEDVELGDFAAGESRTAPEPFELYVEPGSFGQRLELELRVETPGGYTRTDTLAFHVGSRESPLMEDWEMGSEGWTLINGFTRVSSVPGTAEDFIVTDAPGGNVTYDRNWLDLVLPVDLSSYESALLSFRHRPAMGDLNFGLVTIGTIPSPRADPGEINELRDPIIFFTTGYRNEWETAEVDLTPFLDAGEIWLSWYSKYADLNSEGWSLDDIRIVAWDPQAQPEAPTSGEISMFPPYPNPFNPAVSGPVSLRFDLSQLGTGETAVTIRVYDTRGRLVRVLFDGTLANALHDGTVGWDGRNTAGDNVATGIYLIELRAGTLRETRKVLILR